MAGFDDRLNIAVRKEKVGRMISRFLSARVDCDPAILNSNKTKKKRRGRKKGGRRPGLGREILI